jgi:DNA-binding CsgD family transcriptional regulator
LSDRELAVFSLIAARLGAGPIAKELGISYKTVETHCTQIESKLGTLPGEALFPGNFD